MNRTQQPDFKLRAARFVTVSLTLLFIAALFAPTMSAQVASAGAVIGNQASASYTDAAGVSRQAFSNLVQTTVAQVYSGTLAQSQTRYATIGTQVVFPHTYTNTGNGSDKVTITLGSASSGFSNPAIYMDANGDGVPDNTTNISGTQYTLAAGQVLKVVLVGTLSATAGANETDSITAVSAGGGTVTGNPNTDTIVKTSNAAIAVTKSMSASSGTNGTTIGVTLTYTNTGNATATNVVIADPLGSTGVLSTSTSFVYVAGSGKWNGTALTDNSGNWVTTGNSTQYTVASVAPGVTGTITFNVQVGTLATIGSTVNNTANFAYLDGGSPSTQIPTTGSISTNTVPFSVQQNAAVAWTGGDTGDFTAGTPSTDNLNGTSGSGTVAIAQGGSVTFTDTLTNSGNGTDVFNITFNGSTFPAGTTFQFYRADGVTPLTDSNGDGIIDVGPVLPGASATIKVKATLPPTQTSGGTQWFVNVVASSTASTANNFSTASVTMKDEATITITSSTVDVTYSAPANGTSPVGKGSGAASGFSTSVNPGAQVVFPFYVQNTSAQTGTADAYSLSVLSTSSTGAVTVPAVGTALPAGWNLIFHQASGASCPAAYAAQSTPVTSTPALAAANGANAAASYQLFCLEVDTPAAALASTNNFLITALSNASGAEDQMQFAVVVNSVSLVSITPNQSGQIYAGGTVVYKHVITNGGNTAQTVTIPANAVVFTPALAGWSGTLYQDAQTTGTLAGVLDPADTLLTPGTSTISLPIGTSVVVFLKVQASPSANPGDNTDATLNISYIGGTGFVDDVTTVIAGQLKLLKQQSVITHTGVSTCAVVPGTYNTANQQAGSKDCIFYQIQATNTGTTAVTNPSISDSAPPFTTPYASYNSGAPSFSNSCSLTNPTPAFGSGNTFTGSYGAVSSMTPGCTITVVFEVQLN